MDWSPKRGAEVTLKPDVKVWKGILALPKQFVTAYLRLKHSYSSFRFQTDLQQRLHKLCPHFCWHRPPAAYRGHVQTLLEHRQLHPTRQRQKSWGTQHYQFWQGIENNLREGLPKETSRYSWKLPYWHLTSLHTSWAPCRPVAWDCQDSKENLSVWEETCPLPYQSCCYSSDSKSIEGEIKNYAPKCLRDTVWSRGTLEPVRDWGYASNNACWSHVFSNKIWSHAPNDAVRSHAPNDVVWSHAPNDVVWGHAPNNTVWSHTPNNTVLKGVQQHNEAEEG